MNLTNPYTWLFCILPLALMAYMVVLIINTINARRRTEIQKAQLADIRARNTEARTESITNLAEAKTAEINNKIVLQDIRIEREQLKLNKEQLLAPKPFDPNDPV